MAEGVLFPLGTAGLEQEIAAALAAIAAANTPEELKSVQTRSNGDKSPLSMAKREMKNTLPADKATASKNLGVA